MYSGKYIIYYSFIFTCETCIVSDLEMKVPVLLVVVEGDTRTIHQVKAAVKKNIPVLLIKGSGNAADLISDYLNEPIHR